MSEQPWREIEHYQTGRIVKCLGCGKNCHNTKWGKWCYDCNVERIERINKAFEPFRKTIS